MAVRKNIAGMISAEVILSPSILTEYTVLRDLVLSFWGHILYIRNQIPLPVSNITGDVLEKYLSLEENKSRSKALHNRKLLNFDTKYKSLSIFLDMLFSTLSDQNKLHELKTVCVMMGPSASSTLREAHFLHFDLPKSDELPQKGPPENSQNKREQSKRQLIRTLISNWNPESDAFPIMNSFIGLQFEGSASAFSEIQQSNKSLAENCDFTMKENFKIKLRKTSPPALEVRVCSSSSLDTPDIENISAQDSDIIETEPNYWLVLRKGIEGVKSSS